PRRCFPSPKRAGSPWTSPAGRPRPAGPPGPPRGWGPTPSQTPSSPTPPPAAPPRAPTRRTATPARGRARTRGVDAPPHPGRPPPELVPTLTEPFQRGTERVRTDEHAGVGLGLAIVHSIVRAHDGTLDLAPSPNGGLLVTVRLPGTP